LEADTLHQSESLDAQFKQHFFVMLLHCNYKPTVLHCGQYTEEEKLSAWGL